MISRLSSVQLLSEYYWYNTGLALVWSSENVLVGSDCFFRRFCPYPNPKVAENYLLIRMQRLKCLRVISRKLSRLHPSFVTSVHSQGLSAFSRRGFSLCHNAMPCDRRQNSRSRWSIIVDSAKTKGDSETAIPFWHFAYLFHATMASNGIVERQTKFFGLSMSSDVTKVNVATYLLGCMASVMFLVFLNASQVSTPSSRNWS